MNPIIEAVDAGHYNHANKCVTCKTEWPCDDIKIARIENRSYQSPPSTTGLFGGLKTA